MSGQTNEAQWYIARDGKQHGPLTDVEMRTFVGHSYLRPSDLLWRPGMADWQPAPIVYPAAFAQQGQAPVAQTPGPQQVAPQQAAPQQAAQRPAQQQPQHTAAPANMAAAQHGAGAPHAAQTQTPGHAQGYAQGHQPNAPAAAPQNDYGEEHFQEERAKSGLLRQAIIALVLVAIIGGGAFAIVTYKEPLMRLVSGPPKKTAPAATDPATPAATAESAALGDDGAAPAPEGADPALIEGSALDTRLQKVPLWGMLKKEYPDWYISSVAAAEKLVAEKKTELEISTQLVQGLVTLRRQQAPHALAASPEKLRNVASAFLDNLRTLQAQSVSACYGFISKGEMSPAVLEIMQSPENATSLNAQLAAIFEAVSEGSKAPVKHESAVKADYDMLIAELSKLGWKEEDLQVFSNPRMLSKREPAQVCKMVQDWFTAHLAVQDTAAQERLLFETLKPVVSG